MRIDPKYFNTFLIIVAVVGAIVIALFTYANLTGDEQIFKDRINDQDSLRTVYWHPVEEGDSLRIDDFRGNIVVLDFWTERSGASVSSQKQLAEVKAEYGDRLRVIAASVGQREQEIRNYIQKKDYPFIFVTGSQHFSSFNVPAIPAQLVYDPGGGIHSIFIGYRSSAQYDSLRTIIDQEMN